MSVRERMRTSEIIAIAWRYTFTFGRGHLSVFMSGLSVAGLVLATAILLTVLSVMNGFEREMRDRILALVPHLTVSLPARQSNIDTLISELERVPGVERAQAFVSFNGMVLRGTRVTAISGLGLESWPDLPAGLELPGFPKGQGELILGDSVAQRLAVSEGDALTVLATGADSYRAAGIRSERFTVSSIVDTGTELDEALVLMQIEPAAKLADLGLQSASEATRVSGLQIRIADPFAVDRYAERVRSLLPPGAYMLTWRATHGNLHAAIQLSRDLVILLLTSIIGIAAFNVVSALVLIVVDQTRAIAILKTLGATAGNIASVFIVQGALIGVTGAVIGLTLGAVLARFLPEFVGFIEESLGFRFLNTDVYPVSFIPVDLRGSDMLLIGVVAVAACVLAALYPAVRGARLEPARVLS